MPLPSLNDEGNEKSSEKKVSLPDFDMPAIEDDFKLLPVDEVINEEKEDEEKLNEEVYREVERIPEPTHNELPSVEEVEKSSIHDEDDFNPDYEEDLKNEDEQKFIDKKKKKLIPFGGKKSDKKAKKGFIKSSDFDTRKNKAGKTKVIQFSMVCFILLLFVIGLKNTFMPSHVYTAEQIKNFASESVGKTGFPTERGAAFSTNFLTAFLTVDAERTDYQDVVKGFYGNADNVEGADYLQSFGQKYKQSVIIAPQVTSVDLIDDTNANYKLTAYVTDEKGRSSDGEKAVGKWVSYSVNLNYNPKKDTLAISGESPIMIPNVSISSSVEIDPSKIFGDSVVEDEVLKKLTPTINGFIVAYASSTIHSHEEIMQYIVKENSELTSGFGGSVEVDGPLNESIVKTVYNGKNEGEYKVDITVGWKESIKETNTVYHKNKSRYIMEIKETSKGKYAVSSFKPFSLGK